MRYHLVTWLKMLQFKKDHKENKVSNVGSGLERYFIQLFLVFLNRNSFYFRKANIDDKVSFLRSLDPFFWAIFFAAKPGVTREHYHHSKNEKFLVVKGSARFRFRNVITNHYCELRLVQRI